MGLLDTLRQQAQKAVKTLGKQVSSVTPATSTPLLDKLRSENSAPQMSVNTMKKPTVPVPAKKSVPQMSVNTMKKPVQASKNTMPKPAPAPTMSVNTRPTLQDILNPKFDDMAQAPTLEQLRAQAQASGLSISGGEAVDPRAAAVVENIKAIPGAIAKDFKSYASAVGKAVVAPAIVSEVSRTQQRNEMVASDAARNIKAIQAKMEKERKTKKLTKAQEDKYNKQLAVYQRSFDEANKQQQTSVGDVTGDYATTTEEALREHAGATGTVIGTISGLGGVLPATLGGVVQAGTGAIREGAGVGETLTRTVASAPFAYLGSKFQGGKLPVGRIATQTGLNTGQAVVDQALSSRQPKTLESFFTTGLTAGITSAALGTAGEAMRSPTVARVGREAATTLKTLPGNERGFTRIPGVPDDQDIVFNNNAELQAATRAMEQRTGRTFKTADEVKAAMRAEMQKSIAPSQEELPAFLRDEPTTPTQEDVVMSKAKEYKDVKEFIKYMKGGATQYGKYTPEVRAEVPSGYKNISELGVPQDKMVTIYRGIDSSGAIEKRINDGDFVTTDFQSAADYAGSPSRVVSLEIPAKHLYSAEPDYFKEDPFYQGSEYIYTSKNTKPLYSDIELENIWKQANKKTTAIPKKLSTEDLLKKAVKTLPEWKKEKSVPDTVEGAALMVRDNNARLARTPEEKARLDAQGYTVASTVDEIASSNGFTGHPADFAREIITRPTERQQEAYYKKLDQEMTRQAQEEYKAQAPQRAAVKQAEAINVPATRSQTIKAIANISRKQPGATIPKTEKALLKMKLREQKRGATFGVRAGKIVATERLKTRYDARVAKINTVKDILDNRREFIRAAQKQFGLSDVDLKKITRKDIRLMKNKEFKDFLDDIYIKSEELAEKRQAINEVITTIRTNDLKKTENLQKVLGYPKEISKMTTEQLRDFDKVLSQYQAGDEFLPSRMMQTLPNTPLGGMRTTREVLSHLAKQYDLTPEQVASVEIPESMRFLSDRLLARRHPFLNLLVNRKVQGYIAGKMRAFDLAEKNNALVSAARNSRKQTIGGRIVPTDEYIVQWLESDAQGRQVLAKEMTPQELQAAAFQDQVYKAYYEEKVKEALASKTSRFSETYYPHIRRPIFEAIKDSGLKKALAESATRFDQDKKTAGILNERTGDILPYEKWLGNLQYRTGKLVPTKNSARAFEAYVSSFEKARYLDGMIPEIMAYVHVLSPRQFTEKGVEMDTSLQRFVKEYINANKGRVPRALFEPGGKADFAMRTAIALTRVLDLSGSVAKQSVAPIGDNLSTLTTLGAKAYAIGKARKHTAAGQFIARKYASILGKSLFSQLGDASRGLGDKLMDSLFSGYGYASRGANTIFFLGRLTPEEMKTGNISTKRIAELMLEMSEFRAIPEFESIMDKTAEIKTFMQYKGWMRAILEGTVTNVNDLRKNVSKQGVSALKSPEGRKLLYAIGIGSTVGIFGHNYMTAQKNKKDRTIVEDATYRGAQELMSFLSSFDPTAWTSIRVLSFLDDLAGAIKETVQLDKDKEGGLKGPANLAKTLTPSSIKQMLPKGTGPKESSLKGAIEKQNASRQATKEEVDRIFKDIMKAPKGEERLAVLDKYLAENPDLAEPLLNKLEKSSLNRTKDDEYIAQLGVKNGARAQYIYDLVKDMPKDERKNKVIELIDKKIITDDVAEQLAELLAL